MTCAIYNVRVILFGNYFKILSLYPLFLDAFAVGIHPPPRSWTVWNFERLEPVEIIKRKKLTMTSGRRKTRSNLSL